MAEQTQHSVNMDVSRCSLLRNENVSSLGAFPNMDMLYMQHSAKMLYSFTVNATILFENYTTCVHYIRHTQQDADFKC
jgi:hypothetical protein